MANNFDMKKSALVRKLTVKDNSMKNLPIKDMSNVQRLIKGSGAARPSKPYQTYKSFGR
jgi:hypothetical protein